MEAEGEIYLLKEEILQKESKIVTLKDKIHAKQQQIANIENAVIAQQKKNLYTLCIAITSDAQANHQNRPSTQNATAVIKELS